MVSEPWLEAVIVTPQLSGYALHLTHVAELLGIEWIKATRGQLYSNDAISWNA